MRVLDGLAKVLGALVLMLVTLALPLALTAQRTLGAIYDPALMTTAVERYWLGEENMVRLGQNYAREQLQNTPTSEESLVFWRALDAFSPDQWRALMAFIAPQDVVFPIAEEGIQAFYGWLRTPQAPPEAYVSLAPWKQHVNASASALTDWFLAQFRACNVVETATWGEAWLLDDWSLPPLCQPMGASSGVVRESVASALRQAVQEAPNQVNLLDPQRVPVDTLETAKTQLAQARRWVGDAWLFVSLLLLVGVALVTRSWGGFFKAAGSTVGWSGFSLVFLGMAARPLAGQVIQHTPHVPAWAASALQATVVFYMEHILLPLRPLGIGLTVAGAAAWLAGFLLEIRRRKAMADTLRRLEM